MKKVEILALTLKRGYSVRKTFGKKVKIPLTRDQKIDILLKIKKLTENEGIRGKIDSEG